jgi:hypothetical protein
MVGSTLTSGSGKISWTEPVEPVCQPLQEGVELALLTIPGMLLQRFVTFTAHRINVFGLRQFERP